MNDTIHADALARATPKPPDVFCELAPPLTRLARMVAEQTARKPRLAAEGLGEVELADIYRCALPAADEAEIAARVKAEIAVEHRYCIDLRTDGRTDPRRQAARPQGRSRQRYVSAHGRCRAPDHRACTLRVVFRPLVACAPTASPVAPAAALTASNYFRGQL